MEQRSTLKYDTTVDEARHLSYSVTAIGRETDPNWPLS